MIEVHRRYQGIRTHGVWVTQRRAHSQAGHSIPLLRRRVDLAGRAVGVVQDEDRQALDELVSSSGRSIW